MEDKRQNAADLKQQQQQQQPEQSELQYDGEQEEQSEQSAAGEQLRRSTKQRLSKQERRRLKRRERRRRRLRETKRFCMRFFALIFSHLGLSGLIVAYTFVGGLIFRAVELPQEQKVKEEAKNYRQLAVRQLVQQQLLLLCRGGNATSPKCPPAAVVAALSELANHSLINVVSNVTKLVKDDGWNGSFHDHDVSWNFAGALLFVVTIITTIGYGHATPRTHIGMIFTMFCAFFGIPLMFLCLNNIGDYLADGFRLLYTSVCRPYFKRFRLFGGSSQQQQQQVAADSKPNGGGQLANRAQLDMIKVKTNFAMPLQPSAASAADSGSPPVVINRSGFDSPPDPQVASMDDSKARKAYLTARLLPATRTIRRSVSAPEPPSPQLRMRQLLQQQQQQQQHHKSSSFGSNAVPIVDWSNIESCSEDADKAADASNLLSASCCSLSDAEPQAEESAAAAAASSRAAHRISYISIGDNDCDDSSTSSSSWHSSIESGGGTGSSRRRSQTPLQKLRQVTVPLSLSLAVMFGYVVLGAFLFTIWEDADYIKWAYFCFITLSTIGFGDIVPGTEVDTENPKEKLIATTIYVAVGLSVFAMCFKLMQEEVVQKVRRLGRRLGIVKQKEPTPEVAAAEAARNRRQRRRQRRRQKRRQRATGLSVRFRRS